MAQKKVTPKDPQTSKAKASDKPAATERKSMGRLHPRKTGRKSSGLRWNG
jgi:hypothetical protein